MLVPSGSDLQQSVIHPYVNHCTLAGGIRGQDSQDPLNRLAGEPLGVFEFIIEVERDGQGILVDHAVTSNHEV